MATSEEVNRQVADEAIDAYVDWQEERAHVWDAYTRWESAENGDAPFAFSAYRAALDREEQASWVYATRVEAVRAVARGREPVTSIRRLLPW